MLQLLLPAAIASLCVASSALALDPEPLPRLPELEPNVRFWTRIYTETSGQGGLIHDAQDLDVVYEVVHFPDDLSRRARERRVEKIKKRYRAILQRLASGNSSDLSDAEARVLARWPDGTTKATLGRAAHRVRFQLGQADKFRAGLIRAGGWSAHIESVLEEHEVPEELVALPHVESSYNPRAYSRVGAAGIWQFTRSTARRYMRVDHVVDERMDPYRATVAAARLLRDNHQRLGSWPLAITAYNHGVTGIARAVRKLGTSDLATITQRYRSRTFGFASRNFYAEFLAASEIHQNAERYFGVIPPDPPRDEAILETDHFYAVPSLERALGIDRNTLRDHNLALLPAVWNGAKLVPRGYALRIPAELLDAPAEVLLARIPEDERIAQQRRDRFHKVRRGETLSKIAGRYAVKERELVILNNLRSRHRIRAGQVLRLPDDGRARIVVARVDPPPDGIYHVRRGDSLSIISRRFGISERDLVGWNRLRNRNRIAVGQRLRVAPPATVVASAPAAVAEARAAETSPAEAAAAVRPAVGSQAVDGFEPPDAVPAAEDSEPPAQDAAAVAVPDPSNYSVTPDHRITVQADETLGHYAEWLEIPTSRLRRINGMGARTPLVIGRQKKLDFSRVTPEVFEQRRLEYHRSLQEEFFDAYVVSSTRTHTLRKGDSVWYLAYRKYEVPIWLLRQYNPDLDFGGLAAGTPMVIPVIELREERI